jgi:ABC-type antimicrobial peptide transport system permease subunit
MFAPLSSLLYTFRNWLKILPLVGIIALSILGVTITSAIADSATKDLSQNLNFFDHYYLITLKPDKDLQTNFANIKAQLETSESVDYFLEADFSFVQTKAVVAQMRRPVLFLENKDQTRFLKELNLKVEEGDLPSKASEISLTSRTSKNKNLQIGSGLGSIVDKKETWLVGEYKLTGNLNFESVSEDKQFQVGLGYLPTNGLKTTFIIRPKPDKFNNLDSQLKDIQNRFPQSKAETRSTYQEYLNDELGSISQILSIITIVVTLTMTLSAGLISLIFLNQRSEEIGILLAMGYTKIRILSKIITENIIQILFGWILGLSIASIIYNYLNLLIFTPKAISGLTLWQFRTFTSSVPVPLAIIFFTLFAIIYKIYKIDPITIVERK